MNDNHTLRSRKILSFVLLVFGTLATVATTTALHTPENISIQALWVIGIAGLFTIGGQSLVDSVAKFVSMRTKENQ